MSKKKARCVDCGKRLYVEKAEKRKVRPICDECRCARLGPNVIVGRTL